MKVALEITLSECIASTVENIKCLYRELINWARSLKMTQKRQMRMPRNHKYDSVDLTKALRCL